MMSDEELEWLERFIRAVIAYERVGGVSTCINVLNLKDEYKKMRLEASGFAEPKKQGPRPDVCSECDKPVVLAQDGKYRCNCQIWADRENEL